MASLLLKMTLLRTNNSTSTHNKLNYRVPNVQIIVKSTVAMVLSIYSDKVDKVQKEITLRQGFVGVFRSSAILVVLFVTTNR